MEDLHHMVQGRLGAMEDCLAALAAAVGVCLGCRREGRSMLGLTASLSCCAGAETCFWEQLGGDVRIVEPRQRSVMKQLQRAVQVTQVHNSHNPTRVPDPGATLLTT